MGKRRRNWALWLGPVVTFAGVVSYYLPPIVLVPALRDFPWLNLPIALAGVALSVLGAYRAWLRSDVFRGRLSGTIGLVLSLALGSVYVAYVFSLSYMLPDETTTTAGMSVAPEFALLDQHGKTVRLGDHAGRKVVLVFYRGHW